MLFAAGALWLCFTTGFTWKSANQAKVAWNPVKTLENGDAVPDGDTVKYIVYIKDESGKTDTVREISSTQITIDFTVEDKYRIGVSAVRYRGSKFLSESNISWSDVEAATSNNPFGFTSYQKPAKPKGLKTQ